MATKWADIQWKRNLADLDYLTSLYNSSFPIEENEWNCSSGEVSRQAIQNTSNFVFLQTNWPVCKTLECILKSIGNKLHIFSHTFENPAFSWSWQVLIVTHANTTALFFHEGVWHHDIFVFKCNVKGADTSTCSLGSSDIRYLFNVVMKLSFGRITGCFSSWMSDDCFSLPPTRRRDLHPKWDLDDTMH